MKKQDRRNFIKTLCLSIISIFGVKHASKKLAGEEGRIQEVDIDTVREAEFYKEHDLAG